jgi:DNA repair protein RadC
MSTKPIARQKSQPIYTAADIYAIIRPILLRENQMHIKPGDACRMAIYKEIDCVIFFYNHPTDKLNPSPEDKDATKRLIKAREVVYIKVANHFIISEAKYYSFD